MIIAFLQKCYPFTQTKEEILHVNLPSTDRNSVTISSSSPPPLSRKGATSTSLESAITPTSADMVDKDNLLSPRQQQKRWKWTMPNNRCKMVLLYSFNAVGDRRGCQSKFFYIVVTYGESTLHRGVRTRQLLLPHDWKRSEYSTPHLLASTRRSWILACRLGRRKQDIICLREASVESWGERRPNRARSKRRSSVKPSIVSVATPRQVMQDCERRFFRTCGWLNLFHGALISKPRLTVKTLLFIFVCLRHGLYLTRRSIKDAKGCSGKTYLLLARSTY